jgi:tetrapyrrole methylase family protein/MazG family protein
MKDPGPAFRELVRIIARLRGPDGCPWDRAQTHGSLLRFLREESAEVGRAVRRKDFENLKDELGDVLLQVLLHAQLAREAGRFGIDGVLKGLRDKLIRRHPHVYGRSAGGPTTPREVVRRWAQIKREERSAGRRRR